MPGNDPMQVLAAAVTPVVLVSATAVLIGGVNSRYISIADKMRSLAQEFRGSDVQASRRTCILEQMGIFRSRIHLVAWAERTLYAAVSCFVVDVVIIGATAWRKTLASTTLPLFALGISLIFAAIMCQLLELHLSNRTISLEVRDITVD